MTRRPSSSSRSFLAVGALCLWVGCSTGETFGEATPPGDANVGEHGDAGAVPSSGAPGSRALPAGRGAVGPAAGGSSPQPGAAGSGSAEPTSPATDACAQPAFRPLFPEAAAAAPIVERRADGVIVTRGAGRVRGRHELEGTFSPFGPHYFENRSYAFRIEDTIAAGGTTVKFTYLPEAPVSANGAKTNFRHWKIFGNGNVFHSNVTMAEISPRELVYTATRNARANRPMRTGDILDFEFGIFITGNDAADPDPIEGRNSYYSDTFRYQVGRGGLTAYNEDTSGKLGPEHSAAVAGATTIPWIYAEPELYFSQMALNIQPERVQPFLRGRRLFHTDFETGAHSEGGNPAFSAQAGKLGPMFVTHDCVTCHERDGRGEPPPVGMPVQTMAVKLYAPAPLGNQLQTQEGRAVLESYTERTIQLGDGTTITLQKPAFALRDVTQSGLAPSIRVARQIPGAGLLEAIPDAELAQRSDPDDCDDDGISGRAQLVPDPSGDGSMKLGRFGWKAEKISVAHQVADALEADMGVSSPVFPDASGKSELSQNDFDDLVAYTRLLALPARRDAADPAVRQGERLFAEIGCVNCHVPEHTTGDTHPFVELRNQPIRPYTDLLLHDMGDELADGSGTPQASEWRTPPLWGLGLIETVSGHNRLLHDGRARGPLEAVLWHGGEAAFAREAVIGLSPADREALLRFLGSL